MKYRKHGFGWEGSDSNVTPRPYPVVAQRLSEMTGFEAKTIHRLLEFEPKTMGFKRNIENPIPAQAIVIDEASMLDLFLGHSLVKAIPLDAQLLLVGDIDQLPSVGPGNVLRDLIAKRASARSAANTSLPPSADKFNRYQCSPN